MAAPAKKVTPAPEAPVSHASSGNVFADLALPDAEELLAKAELVYRIGSIIRHRHLTQTEAAAVLGIDQPKVSALLRGRIEGFSTDRLLRFFTLLDRDVGIVIKKKSSAKAQASLRVVMAS